MKTIINEELIAAFLEGKTTLEESATILRAAEKDKNLQNLLHTTTSIDNLNNIPYGAVAAETTNCGNKCAVLCEQYVLGRLGVEKDIDGLELKAKEEGWLNENGMSIENIGCLMESERMVVKRSFHNSIEDLKRCIQNGAGVITMVDAAETFGECNDTEKGFTPNHAVVVLGIDEKDVLFYDPEWEENRRLSHRDFTEAWNDSSGFMVTCQSERKKV